MSASLAAGGGKTGDAPRVEPRWLTLADVMLVVAALALGLATRNLRFETVAIPYMRGPIRLQRPSIFWTAIDGVATVALGVALATLARQAKYRRMPRPAEWFPIALGAALVAQLAWFGDEWPVARESNARLRRWEPVWASAAPCLTLFALLVLALSPAGRRPWGRTVLAAALLLAVPVGPAAVFEGHVLPWLARSLWNTDTMFLWNNSLLEHGTLAAGRLPRALVFVVPGLAAVADRLARGRKAWVYVRWADLGAVADLRRVRTPWLWTEWAGLLLALMMASYWLCDLAILAAELGDPVSRVELLVGLGWTAALVPLGALLLRLGAGRWARWVAPLVEPGPAPIVIRPASPQPGALAR